MTGTGERGRVRGTATLVPERTGLRRHLPRLPRRTSSRRILALLLLYVVLAGVVVARLVEVQVVEAEAYAARGTEQRARTLTLPPDRGRLYDRDGEILAMSIPAATVYADPRAFRSATTAEGERKAAADPDAVARELAPLLGQDAGELAAQLRKDAHFVYLARQVDPEVGERIASLELPGIGILTEPRRVYPGGDLAGQIIGFTDIDGRGLHGLEFQYDELLQGEPGQLVLERAPGGLAIASGARELAPAISGTDLVLTIDRDIQHVAERAAGEAVAAFDAAGASVLVLDVDTGEVLAMASAPTFDANDRTGADPAAFRNRAVTDVFEPGSVQKAITAAAAIEEGIVHEGTVLRVEDSILVGRKRFTDAHENEPRDMTFGQIIEESSNVGTIMVAQRLGEQRLAEYLDRFGFGRRLGLGFPGESPGILMPVDQWWQTSLPTIAIGQGVATTLLQNASFYATIANDGIAVQPRILRGTVGADGRLKPLAEHRERRVVSAGTSAALRRILGRVVSGETGTGGAAAVPGYEVAGKTGTARKPRTDGRGYSGKYVATFVGFAPVEDPRLVVAVMVDEPYPIWGGVVAAPVFREVMQFSLLHRRVAPTGDAGSVDAALDAAAAELAAAEGAAAERARAEGPATGADTTTSPPVGAPAGGDGEPVSGAGGVPSG